MDKSLHALLWKCRQPLIRRAARAYVAGPDLADALAVCHRMFQQGIAGTLCFWNRAGDSPETTAEAYGHALNTLATERLPCQLSVKAPAFGFSHDLFAEILERGRRSKTTVIFDSLGPETVDSTFALIENALPHYPALGCTLPGRWQRSLRDADVAMHLKLSVRVVKGQWADPNDSLRDPAAGFLAVIDRLAGRARQVTVATHDPALAREALRRLLATGTSCELELLFGLPVRQALHVAREQGVPVRLYIPYGFGALPYRLAHVPKMPRLLWWFIRDLLDSRSASRVRSLDGGDIAAQSVADICQRLGSGTAVLGSESKGH